MTHHAAATPPPRSNPPLPTAPRVLPDQRAAEAWAHLDATVRDLVGGHPPARLLPLDSEPEDLVQAVLTEVLVSIAEFRPEPGRSFTGFVNAILARRARNLRRRSRDAASAQYLSALEQHHRADPAGGRPAFLSIAAELQARARRAVQALERRDNRVLTLREDHGLPFREIGLALGGMAEATAHALFRAARERRARSLRASFGIE